MADKKITKREMFAEVIAMAQGKETKVSAEDIVAFAEREIELLAKKSSTKSKAEQAKDAEMDALMDVAVAVLEKSDKGMTVTEIMASDVAFDGLSNQKVSAVMRKLKDAGRVEKDVVKGKSVFSVPTSAEEVEDAEVEETSAE